MKSSFNIQDLRGSAGYSASCGGTAKYGISTANRFRPLKREQLLGKAGVKALEFGSGVVGAEPPVYGDARCVALGFVGGDLALQGVRVEGDCGCPLVTTIASSEHQRRPRMPTPMRTAPPTAKDFHL